MKVKNFKETPIKLPEGFSSPLAWWEGIADRKAGYCSRTKCSNSPTTAGYVKKDNSKDDALYLVSLCEECLAIDEDEVYLVTARSLQEVDE